VVWFSWITFKSRAHRDRVNAAVMKDKRMSSMMTPEMQTVLDAKRAVYGGFKVEVEA
jgi:uncharacterized protein YbaA (DUF1428 family)